MAGLAVDVPVVGVEVVLIDLLLEGAHLAADDLAEFGDDLDAGVLLAAAEDDGAEELPEAVIATVGQLDAFSKKPQPALKAGPESRPDPPMSPSLPKYHGLANLRLRPRQPTPSPLQVSFSSLIPTLAADAFSRASHTNSRLYFIWCAQFF